jgi:hypothetical protein
MTIGRLGSVVTARRFRAIVINHSLYVRVCRSIGLQKASLPLVVRARLSGMTRNDTHIRHRHRCFAIRARDWTRASRHRRRCAGFVRSGVEVGRLGGHIPHCPCRFLRDPQGAQLFGLLANSATFGFVLSPLFHLERPISTLTTISSYEWAKR